jgi:hypothetical protein
MVYYKFSKSNNEDDPMANAVMSFLMDFPEVAGQIMLNEKGTPIRGTTGNSKLVSLNCFKYFRLVYKFETSTKCGVCNISVYYYQL